MTTLKQAAEAALKVLECPQGGRDMNDTVLAVMQASAILSAALAEPESPAFPDGYEPHELPSDYTGKLWIEGQVRQLHDLATRPKPLTDEDLEALAEKFVTNCYFDTLKYARAIEVAHGIKP